MNQIDLSPLQKYLRTTTEARSMQLLLRQFIDQGFRIDKVPSETLQAVLPYEIATFITKLTSIYKVNHNDAMQMQVLFKNVIAAVNDLPVVAITLARPPEITLITSMQDWFLREYNKLVLLDISINPELIAGGVISFKGKYFDCSLKKKLDQGLGVRD